jgi:hypothetical protein
MKMVVVTLTVIVELILLNQLILMAATTIRFVILDVHMIIDGVKLVIIKDGKK